MTSGAMITATYRGFRLIGVVWVFLAAVGYSVESTAQVLTPGWSMSAMGTGERVAGAGDVDGDGFDDVMVLQETPQQNSIRVYRGSASGVAQPVSSTIPVAMVSPTDIEMAAAGDVDGDGYDDVLIGEVGLGGPKPTDGRVSLYTGSSSGLSTQPAWRVRKSKSDFGFSVDGAGDLNGDGFDDVVVGSPGFGVQCTYSWQGRPASRVFVYFGSNSGLSKTADWSFVQQNANRPHLTCLGFEVAGAGDVDDDGYADLLVSALTYPHSNRGDGRVYLFDGSKSGLAATPDWKSLHPRAKEGHFAEYGEHMISQVDLNGDGYEDIVISGVGTYREGRQEERLFTFFGSPNGLSARPATIRSRPLFGYSYISGVGDVDDDGYDDVILWRNRDTIELFYGSSSGLVDTPAWSLVHPNRRHYVHSAAGDVNGDGYADVIVGSSVGRGATVYRGGANPAPVAKAGSVGTVEEMAVEVTLDASDPAGDPLTFGIAQPPADGQLRDLKAQQGKVTYVPDGDFVGQDSFVFRAEDPFGGSDTATIDVTVDSGNRPPAFVDPTPSGTIRTPAGRRLTFEVVADDPDGDAINYAVEDRPAGADFDAAAARFGWTPGDDRVGQTVTVGLVADDGEAEARRDVAIEVTAGVSDTGVDADSGTFDTGPDVADADTADTEDVARADTDIGAEPPPERLKKGCGCGSSGSGRPVGGAAIVAVLLVGLLRRRRGAIVATTTLVCLLAATGAEAQVLTRGLSIGQMGAGQEVAGVGDVDGDGFDDVLIYDGSAGEIALHRGSGSGAESTPTQTIALGSSHSSEIVLAGAGDVDGDGHADVLVGDPAIDAGQGNPTGGRVDLYYGSPGGLKTPAGWTISGADSNLGLSVAGAGDLNGDGFADVVVGSPDADSCAGSGAAGGASHVYVFFGSASGLSQSAGWSTDEQSATASCLGASVDGAGDVDGDGYDDLLVGAPGYPNASKPDGRVFLYRGSASGLPTGPNWASTQPGAVGDSRYGMQVAGAGDIDGDGFADVLVAGEADFGNGAEGRFFVFGGSASGLAERPGWQRSIAAADSDAGEFAGAGDIDGDGMGDLLVWTDNDSIAMYQGSGAGIVEPAAWRLGRAGIGYGESVDAAGDVDGDGHADVVVGTERRGAFVFRGGPNPAPSAKMRSLTIEAGRSRTVALLADDMHGDPLTYAIEAEPQHGTVSMLDPDKGEVTYAADPDYDGADGFDFRVEDPFGGSDTATVSVTVNVPNDPPMFVAPTPEQQVQAYAGRRLSFGVAAEDPDGDPVTLSARNLPDGASFEEETGEFVWTPRQAGTTELVTFVADDGTETTDREVFIGVDAPPEDAGPEADAEVADTVDAAEPGGADEEGGDAARVDASEPDERPEETGCRAAGPAAPGGLSGTVLVVALILIRRFADR